MSIPLASHGDPGEGALASEAVAEPERCEWSRLTGADKRERLLAAAASVFSEHGLDAPMSDVADAAGAGVASIYRLYPSKHELYAALVVRRMEQITEAAVAAESQPGDRWTALETMLRGIVARQAVEPFIGEARALVAEHPDVVASSARAAEAQERVLAAARAEGRLRADATTLDLRLVYAATRAAKRQEPEQWSRMLELMLAALDTRLPDR